jgi:hypothetical protein
LDLTLQPVCVANGYDEEGLLVFAEERLVAVLVRLSDHHGELAGRLFLEVGFGGLTAPGDQTFPDIEAARAHIERHVMHDSTCNRPEPAPTHSPDAHNGLHR